MSAACFLIDSQSLFRDRDSRVGLWLLLLSLWLCRRASHIFCVAHKGLRGVFLWRFLSLGWHFVCHPRVTINLSVPVFSVLWSLYLPSLCLSVYSYFLDFLVERDNDYCVCETPCNMTRYGKEMSFVKIPSKASAKYLAKKFNKTEQYIAWVTFFRLAWIFSSALLFIQF